MRNLSAKEFQRILIIKPSSFGDVIHALPVLNGLRQRFPQARISWLVSTACAGLLEDHPALDEIIPFDRKRFGRLGRNWRVTVEFIAFVRELAARRFDLVIDLQGLFRSGFLALASGARVRIGLGDAREFAWLFHTDRLPLPAADMHAVDRYYLVAPLLGFSNAPISFDLAFRQAAQIDVTRMLAEGGLSPGQAYALISPGTRWETKRWPAACFARVARKLHQNHHLPVVLAGASDELEVARLVASEAGVPVINLAGRTSLPQMIALVAGARLVVMNDTGPVHLASALDKPTVAIYGPTSAARTGPYGRQATVCRLDLHCSPCYLKKVADCPYGHRCMKELTVDMVAARIAARLTPGAS